MSRFTHSLIGFALAGLVQTAHAAPPRAYIESSYLLAPRAIGGLTLVDSHYDPNTKAAGASFRYALEGRRELRVDVFIYPAGDEPAHAAMERGMRDFRSQLDYAQSHGIYSELKILDQSTFQLGDRTRTEEQSQSANEVELVALNSSLPSSPLTAERLRMIMELTSAAMTLRSNGYLLYRQQYFFKLRASAAAQHLDQDQFDTLTNQAAQALLPALEAAHVGACGDDKTINLYTLMTPEQNLIEFSKQLAAIEARNCHASAQALNAKITSEGIEAIRIDFEPDEWKSP